MNATQEFSWTARLAAIVAPRRRTDLVEEGLNNEAILSDPCTGHIHWLNKTAVAVWHLCDGEATTRQIAGRMAEAWDVDTEDALDYVDQLVARFAEMQIAEPPVRFVRKG